MKQFKIGDLVKRWAGSAARAGLVVDTGQRWKAMGGPGYRAAGAMQQFVTVLWSNQNSTSFEWSDRLERFDPQSTKEYNAN
jgi:hypothetical protein